MNPSRGVRSSALLVLAIQLAFAAVPAVAQTVFDDPSPFLDGPADVLARSPRLLGMGRLSWVLGDGHHRINLWDLGQNPIGVLDADSVSTVEFEPTSGANSTNTLVPGIAPSFQRQTSAGRDFRTYYEAWHRSGSATYGGLGSWNASRSDALFGEGIERRIITSRPDGMPIIAGRVPGIKSDRVRYALRAIFATPSTRDHFRLTVENAAGQYIDHNGAQIGPPDFFAPEEILARSNGAGMHLGFRASRALNLAAGYDYLSHKLSGSNQGFRNAAEVRELRPYHLGQLSATGGLGRSFEWGADLKSWSSKSNQTWAFTTSAGTASDPLTGRGKLFDRKEEGSAFTTRVRWIGGGLEIGAGAITAYRKVEVVPPTVGDASSFNHFVDLLFLRDGADTLAIPDSIVHNTIAIRSWDVGGGAAWTSTSKRTVLGFEGHLFHSQRDAETTGSGPRRLGWDVRAGLERRVAESMQHRAGLIHRWDDLDDFTAGNEFITESATGGLGIHPHGTSWTFDVGYAYAWTRADYPDAANPRSSRQQLSSRLRWAF